VSVLESRGRRRPPRRRRWRTPLLAPGGVVALALAFVVGLAVGRAVEEGPRPGGTVTQVRTLTPLELPPATRTVTVTSP
jgi:hypothetical protein